MNILLEFIQTIFILFFPIVVLLLSKSYKIFKWLSPVVLCYLAGLIIANLPGPLINQELSLTISQVSIPIAIALILFSINFLSWFHHARKAALSFLLCIIGGTVSSVIASFVFSAYTEDSWKIAGMTIGVYTGGTPNMSAIGLSLNVKEELFIMLHAADIVLGGIYLIFLMTLAHPLLKRFFPAYQIEVNDNKIKEEENFNIFKNLCLLKKFKFIGVGLLIAMVILGVSVGISYIFTGRLSILVIILSVTSLAIGSSFINKIRKLPGTFELGEYLLLVFCIAIGSLADINQLIDSTTTVFYFVSFVLFGAVLIHFLLARMFNIDADTVIITSVAGIYGPAFVPPVASVMKNKEIILTGLTTGILGYAIANYWGLMVAFLLQP